MNNFDVLKRMGELNRNIMLAPLSNIVRAKAVKAGTEITIGVGGNVIAKVLNGEYVGGLILADAKEFEATKAELEQEAK